MSSMHLFTDDDDEFQIRQTAEGRLYEVELGRGTWLMLRRGHVEKLTRCSATRSPSGTETVP